MNKSDSRLLKKYMNHVKLEKRLALNSVEAYERDLTDFLEYLDSRGLCLTQADSVNVSEYVIHLSKDKDFSDRSLARAISSLRGFLKFLLEDEKLYGGYRPRRTYNGMRYQPGYSDHLPLVVRFK